MKETKICTKCKKEKNFREFSKDREKEFGLRYWCRKCDNKSREKYSKTEKGKKVNIKSGKKYAKINPEKRKAKDKVRYAIKTGNLIRQKSCSICGKTNCKIEAHHNNYSKYFDVIWCCKQCHIKLDEQRRQKEKLEKSLTF